MNVLTVDTVLDKTYIALLLGEKEIFKTIESDEKNYHSAYLVQTIKTLLEENNISAKEVNYLGVNTGVGSFTGIRVGLSFAKIFTNRLNIKAVPFNTQEAFFRGYNTKDIMLDARRGSVFYSNDGESIKMIPYSEALEILKASESKFITEKSLLKNQDFQQFKEQLIPFEENPVDLAKWELKLVLDKISRNEAIDSVELKPTYIQTPPIFCK